MEVKEFVKAILKEVTEAVIESKNEKVNFYLMQQSDKGIEFDLAVVSKNEGKGKLGLEVWGLGGKAEGSVSNEVVNRIKFKVHPDII